jgi:hypothetical protein
MPNHCDNRLTVYGPLKDVEEFVAKCDAEMPLYDQHASEGKQAPRSVLAFHALVPIANYAPGMKYDPDGIDAERAAWGVKWGAYSEQRHELLKDERGAHILYEFQTAWGVADTWLKKVSQMYPTLTFAISFFEESPTRGRAIYRLGVEEVVQFDEHEAYPKKPDGLDDTKEKEWFENVYKPFHEDQYVGHAEWVADLRSRMSGPVQLDRKADPDWI